jgi:hypothetical protein
VKGTSHCRSKATTAQGGAMAIHSIWQQFGSTNFSWRGSMEAAPGTCCIFASPKVIQRKIL